MSDEVILSRDPSEPAARRSGSAPGVAGWARPRIDTLRRLRLRQVVARLARRARFRWLYPRLGGVLFPRPAPLEAGTIGEDPFHEDLLARVRPAGALRRRAGELAARRFGLLGLPPADLGTPVDWQREPDGDRLWSYDLHYGEWALDLAHARSVDVLIELLEDWMEHNPVGRAPAWDPYPLARRLVHWSRLAFAASGARWREFQRRSLEPLLRSQARFLAANLEHDVPNNHLLADYRALAWVGLLFDSWPESWCWRRRGLEGLWREMRRQVLPDGVHCERSVSYHTIVLQDLLETWCLARRRGVEVPGDVAETLRAMLRFLAATRAPDGTWPGVNDSVPGYPIDPRDVLLAAGALFEEPGWLAAGQGGEPGYALWLNGSAPAAEARPDARSLAVFADAGYAVLRDPHGGYLFFDAGPMGPPEIPGHGHADALSIVLHGGGRPLVVDPGVASYAAGPSRDRCRSLAVHNSVCVDGVDPCVFWAPFRVASPPPARLLEASEEHVLGEHLGYRRRGVVHRRRVTRRAAGVWEIRDRFEGRGVHRFAFNLQLAPGGGLEIEALDGWATWSGGIGLAIRPLGASGDAVAAVAGGAVSPGWHRWDAAPRYILRWESAVPCDLRVLLTVCGEPGLISSGR